MFYLLTVYLLFGIKLSEGMDILAGSGAAWVPLCLSNLTVDVDIDTKKNLSYMVFQQNAEIIEVSFYVEKQLLDRMVNKSEVNPTVALPPYHRWVWVNGDGMTIYRMDYRFKMWSLGTLIPSVHALDFKIHTSHPKCFMSLNVTEKFTTLHQIFMRTLFQNNSCSRLVVDYTYLCHRYERYEKNDHCLGTKCYIFNAQHDMQDSLGFCSENVNRIVDIQMKIWIFICFIAINCIPFLIFSLRKDVEEKSNESSAKEDDLNRNVQGKMNESEDGANPLTEEQSSVVENVGQDLNRQTIESSAKEDDTNQNVQDEVSASGEGEYGAYPLMEDHVTVVVENVDHSAESQTKIGEISDRDDICGQTSVSGADEWVRLFSIDKSNCKYYPLIAKWCFLIFLDDSFIYTLFRFLFIYFILLPFFVWWFIIANFKFYRLENIQRQNMSDKYDVNLLRVEWLFDGIFNLETSLFLFCFIIASLGNIVWVYVLSNPACWNSKRFLHLADLHSGTFLDRYRPSLLINVEFWLQFWYGCIPQRLQNARCLKWVSLLWFIPLAVLAVLALCLPMFDLILHIPWSLWKEYKCSTILNSNREELFENEWDNTPLVRTTTEQQNGVVSRMWYFVVMIILSCFYAFSLAVTYFYTSTQVISMIVSYTIIGLMKNWDFLLPILVLVLIAIAQMINLLYCAFQPMHKLQVTVFDQCKLIDPSLLTTRNIIREERNGKYFISKSFIKDCYQLLDATEYSHYTLYSFIKFVTIILILVVTGLSIYMLTGDTSTALGKVVVAIFLTFVPHALKTLIRPWRNDVRKSIMERQIRKKIEHKLECPYFMRHVRC